MSIQGEITRITSARDSSFTAVAEKGVIVPTNSTIDDLPGLIRSIQGDGNNYFTKIVGGIWATGSGTTYTTLGTYSSTAGNIVLAEENFVTYADGVFTFVKEGTYVIYYAGRGGYNSSGTTIYQYFKFLPDTTWPSITSNTYANVGRSGSFTITVNVGDTLYCQTRNNSGTSTHDFCYFITLDDGGYLIPWALGEEF